MSISLNALDDRGSLQWASTGGAVRDFSYTPFGSTPSRGHSPLPGFNGERLDPLSQHYHLGNGYRTYHPILMRFNASDSWSPFGAGGLNQYAYCEGDPINRSDPSGHLSKHAWGGIAFGILGLLGSIFSAGMSIAAAGGLAAAIVAASSTDILLGTVGSVADVSALASGATSKSDPQLSRVTGWMSFALGTVGMIAGAALAGKTLYSKLTQRTEPTRLLSAPPEIEMQPLIATPTVATEDAAPFADASLPGPSSPGSSPDINAFRNMPKKNPSLIRSDSGIDGGRVIRNAQGTLEYEDGVPVLNEKYQYAFSKENHMYFSRHRTTPKTNRWSSVNVRSAGEVHVENGRIAFLKNSNKFYIEKNPGQFAESTRHIFSFGFIDRDTRLSDALGLPMSLTYDELQ